MNDATLPPHRSSSVAGAADVPSSSSSSSAGSAEKEFPFLVHSQDAVNNGEPPEIDNGKLARQKRRRTSPEDQATLEAEYKRNPKPDKAARQEIVKRVALGEKEVQIWFQNRRQNTRRKSRPLLPHEIAAFGLGGMAALSSDPLSSSGIYSGGSQSGSQEDQSRTDTTQLQFNSSPNDVEDTMKNTSEELRRASSTGGQVLTEESEHKSSDKDLAVPKATTFTESIPAATSTGILVETPTQDAKTIPSQEPVHSIPSSLGYFANRRNAMNNSFSTPSSLQHPSFETPPSHDFIFPSSAPERLGHLQMSTPSTSSGIRLSLSLDGKAELSEISPPRALAPRPSFSADSNLPRRRTGGLQRSQSALPFPSLKPKTSQPSPLPSRMPSGRSRNARTWELLCDTEARDELTTQAENESSGSAVAAINLIRSTSGSALKVNQNKRNAAVRSETNTQGKRAKLERSNSSLARLQSSENTLLNLQRCGKDPKLMKSPSGDSDKENWLPYDNTGAPRRRPVLSAQAQKQGRKRVLEDNTNIPTLAGSLGVTKNRSRKRKSQEGGPNVYEDPKPVDPDVETFMRGAVSPSKRGDLDCVAGLLSLSQGNWK